MSKKEVKEIKGFKQAKKTINGTEYTFQKLPVRAALDLRSTFIDFSTGEVDMEKAYPAMLEHIVVHPKKTLDDFEEVWEVDELVAAAIDFQYGKKK